MNISIDNNIKQYLNFIVNNIENSFGINIKLNIYDNIRFILFEIL